MKFSRYHPLFYGVVLIIKSYYAHGIMEIGMACKGKMINAKIGGYVE